MDRRKCLQWLIYYLLLRAYCKIRQIVDVFHFKCCKKGHNVSTIFIKKQDVERIFSNIYRKGIWGRMDKFFSGYGSMPENALPYIDYVNKFIKENNVKSVVDLGCGDFSVGQRIALDGVEYTGIDVVGTLIDRNDKLFASNNIKFLQRDIISEELPEADLCLVRQVFQHLSNDAILKVIPKLKKYKCVFVTDAWLAKKAKRINLDKPIGASTRSNGLYLDLEPFNLKIESALEYLTVDKMYILKTVKVIFNGNK